MKKTITIIIFFSTTMHMNGSDFNQVNTTLEAQKKLISSILKQIVTLSFDQESLTAFYQTKSAQERDSQAQKYMQTLVPNWTASINRLIEHALSHDIFEEKYTDVARIIKDFHEEHNLSSSLEITQDTVYQVANEFIETAIKSPNK